MPTSLSFSRLFIDAVPGRCCVTREEPLAAPSSSFLEIKGITIINVGEEEEMDRNPSVIFSVYITTTTTTLLPTTTSFIADLFQATGETGRREKVSDFVLHVICQLFTGGTREAGESITRTELI